MHGARFFVNSAFLQGSVRLATERKPPFWILERPPAKSLPDTSQFIVTWCTQRAKTLSHSSFVDKRFFLPTRGRLCASEDAYLNNFFPTLYIKEIRETTLWSEQSVSWNCSLNFSTGDVRWNRSHPRFDTYIVQNTFKYAEDWLRN